MAAALLPLGRQQGSQNYISMAAASLELLWHLGMWIQHLSWMYACKHLPCRYAVNMWVKSAHQLSTDCPVTEAVWIYPLQHKSFVHSLHCTLFPEKQVAWMYVAPYGSAVAC